MPRKVKTWHLEIRHQTGEHQKQFLGGQQSKVLRPRASESDWGKQLENSKTEDSSREKGPNTLSVMWRTALRHILQSCWKV